MSFRDRVDMLVVFPKTQLAHYVDNTMPKRDWSEYDTPAWERKPSKRAQPLKFGTIQSQTG